MNTNQQFPAPTTPRELSASDLITRAGGVKASDQSVIFTGKQYNGTEEWVTDPLASKQAYANAVDAENEIIATTTTFDDCAFNDLRVCAYRVARSLGAGFARTVKQNRFHVPDEVRVEVGFDAAGQMQYETVGSDWTSMPGIPASQFKVTLEYGTPVIHVHHPRLREIRTMVNGFLDFVRDEIKQRSIYRGKVITPDFKYLWVTPIEPDDAIYNDDIQAVLGPVGLGPIMFPEARDKFGLARKVGLALVGQAGTGKSLFTGIETTVAQRYGCTVVKVEAGADIDQISKGFKVARMYQSVDKPLPVVLIVEDIEKVGSQPEARARLLDLIDGMDAKGLRIVIIATTNFPDQLDPALMRPGRLDQVVEMKLPDKKSLIGLVQMKLGHLLEDDIDWDKAFPHYEGYTQSWIVGSTESVLSAAIWRAKGKVDDGFKVTTDDLIASALAYRDQYEMQRAAEARAPEVPTLDQALRELVHGPQEVSTEKPVLTESDLNRIEGKADVAIERRLSGASISLSTEAGRSVDGKLHTN